MHQSSLGALFLIAPSKMHPLWYSPFMPVFFFISSMVAGLSMVIFEGTLSHKALHNKMDETHLREADGVVFGFGRAASFVLIGYFIIKVLDTTMDNDWHYLASGYGAWFAVEMVGFVLLPAFLPARLSRARPQSLPAHLPRAWACSLPAYLPWAWPCSLPAYLPRAHPARRDWPHRPHRPHRPAGYPWT